MLRELIDDRDTPTIGGVRGLAHELREVSDRLNVLADVLQFPEPGDVMVEEIYRDQMETVGQTSSTVTGIAQAAETVV